MEGLRRGAAATAAPSAVDFVAGWYAQEETPSARETHPSRGPHCCTAPVPTETARRPRPHHPLSLRVTRADRACPRRTRRLSAASPARPWRPGCDCWRLVEGDGLPDPAVGPRVLHNTASAVTALRPEGRHPEGRYRPRRLWHHHLRAPRLPEHPGLGPPTRRPVPEARAPPDRQRELGQLHGAGLRAPANDDRRGYWIVAGPDTAHRSMPRGR